MLHFWLIVLHFSGLSCCIFQEWMDRKNALAPAGGDRNSPGKLDAPPGTEELTKVRVLY